MIFMNTLHVGLVSVRRYTPAAVPTDLVGVTRLEPGAACRLIFSLSIVLVCCTYLAKEVARNPASTTKVSGAKWLAGALDL